MLYSVLQVRSALQLFKISLNRIKTVRAVVRDVDRARKVIPSSAEIVVADASKPDSIKPAFHNVSVIYHCVNVPYDKWTEVMPIVTDNILAGAIEMQANVVFPGNVYVYGRFQRIPATEDHPLATSKKGRLRIALERELMDAHSDGKVKVVIPRFPDYYGPNVTDRLMKPILMAALSGKKVRWIGNLNVRHDLVFIEDVPPPVLCSVRLQVLMAKCGMSQGQGLLRVESLSI